MKANFWVSMTDTFLSGWGGAEGKIHKQIVECENRRQAEVFICGIMKVKDHDGMKDINVHSLEPYFAPEQYTKTFRSIKEWTLLKQYLDEEEQSVIWNKKNE